MSNAEGTPGAGAWTWPYWDAVAEGRLLFQQCADCGRATFPPRRFCPGCASARLEWRESAGTGFVYSYSVVERGALPEFEHLVPYVVAIVQLDEGPRIVSRLLDTEPGQVACDARVGVVFDGGLPMFRLTS